MGIEIETNASFPPYEGRKTEASRPARMRGEPILTGGLTGAGFKGELGSVGLQDLLQR